MKGIVFTELIEMVEERYGPEMADRIIVNTDLPSGGVYTAVGTYDHAEAVKLVVELNKETGVPVPDLLHTFGRHLFIRFVKAYPAFFEHAPSAFSFLEQIDNHVHVEVRKLYPDAELPRFECSRPAPNSLVMTYISKRRFGALAEGLIAGCIDHFGEKIRIDKEDLSDEHESRINFRLTKY